MTEQLPYTSAHPISLLRKESNCPITGRERKRKLCDLNERELLLESPDKPNNQIVNYEEEFTGKPREKTLSVLNINNTEELFKGLDEESTFTPIFSKSLYELPHYNDNYKLEESSVDPYMYVYNDEVMTEDISDVVVYIFRCQV